MVNSKSKFLELSKKFKILKRLYFFYNIYIRNFKFLKNGTQFGEDKYIIELFDKNFVGKFPKVKILPAISTLVAPAPFFNPKFCVKNFSAF